MNCDSQSNLYPPQDFANSVLAALRASGAPAELIETHISWIFLTEKLAYKIKKPVKNDFLDFSTLALRKFFCEEELRLDRRFAADIYLDVVPVTCEQESLEFGGAGQPCEYAVKMRRFPTEDLLGQRVKTLRIASAELERFAQALADFHQVAAHAPEKSSFGNAEQIRQEAYDNVSALDGYLTAERMARLRSWTEQTWQSLDELFRHRQQNGFIRECHGDLHADNIVRWQGRFIPFDGIEFNPQFRWIDCLSDAAFLAMDLLALGRSDLSCIFVNSYLEASGDYAGIGLLRWYMVYRALVRAKVSRLAMDQHTADTAEFAAARGELERHLELAEALSTRTHTQHAGIEDAATIPPLTRSNPNGLWITHGLSGSGKSTIALRLVEQLGAVRLRSDVERKRLWGKPADFRADAQQRQRLYSAEMNQQTYQRLRELSEPILAAGYPVVVDAAFLKREQRDLFRQLAHQSKMPFGIIDCQTDSVTQQQRLTTRQAAGSDASDADERVLQEQMATQDTLAADEQKWVVLSEDIS